VDAVAIDPKKSHVKSCWLKFNSLIMNWLGCALQLPDCAQQLVTPNFEQETQSRGAGFAFTNQSMGMF